MQQIELRQQLLSSLDEHIQAINGILERLGIKDREEILAGCQNFLNNEKKKLVFESKTAKARLFLELKTADSATEELLKKSQNDLQDALGKLVDADDSETRLRPYEDFIDGLNCKDSGKIIAIIGHLMTVFPYDLLGKAFLERKVILPPVSHETTDDAIQNKEPDTKGTEGTSSTPEPKAALPDKKLPQKKASSIPTTSASEQTTTPEEEIPDEVKEFFSSEMMLPQGYDYGTLKKEAKPKANKITGIRQMKSDIRKAGDFATEVHIALHMLADHTPFTADLFQRCVAMYHPKYTPEQVKGIAEYAMNHLFKEGYLCHYSVDGIGDYFIASPKLDALYNHKEVRQYLKYDESSSPSSQLRKFQKLDDTPKYAMARLAVTQVEEAYSTSIGLQYSYSNRETISATMFCTKSEFIEEGYESFNRIAIGIFADSLDPSDVMSIRRLHSWCSDDAYYDTTLAGMEKAQLEALYKHLKSDEQYKNLLQGKVYYYLLPKHQLYDLEWQETQFDDLPKRQEAPINAPAPEAEIKKSNDEDEKKSNVSSVPAEGNKTSAIPAAGIKTVDVNRTESPKQESKGTLPSNAKASEGVSKKISTVEPEAPSAPINPIKEPATIDTGKKHTDITEQVVEAVSQGTLSGATAYLKYRSQQYKELEPDYLRLAYAVHDPSILLKYTSDTISSLFSTSSTRFDSYLEAASACRTFFYNDTEYDYSMHTLQDMVSGTELGIQPLTKFLYELLKFKEDNNRGVDFYADYRTHDQQAIEKELVSLQQKAQNYIETMVNKRTTEQKAQKRFVEAKKIIFSPKAAIPVFLQDIAERDTSDLDFLEEYLKETFLEDNAPVDRVNISADKLNKLIDDTWSEAAKHIRNVQHTSLVSKLRMNLYKSLEKVANLFCDWIQTAGKASLAEDDTGLVAYRRIRTSLLTDLTEAMKELQGSQDAANIEDIAGRQVLSACLQELENRLTGKYAPHQEKYFYIDFLMDDRVLLDEEFHPDFRHWKYLDDDDAYAKDILASGKHHTLSEFKDRLRYMFEDSGDDYLSAQLIDQYLQDVGEASYIQEQGNKLNENIEYAKKDMEQLRKEFIEELELAQSYGQLDTTHENQKEEILQVISDCYQYAEASKNFGVFRIVQAYYKQKIMQDARKRGEVLQEELQQSWQQFRSQNNGTEDTEEENTQKNRLHQIERMIKIQNYTVAEDMLNRWRSHEPEDEFHFDDGKDYLQDFLYTYDTNYNKVSRSGFSLQAQLNVQIHNKDTKGASGMIKNWITSGGNLDPNRIKMLLQSLGWSVENVAKEKPRPRMETFYITLQRPKNGRRSNYKHPIAAFGSIAEQEGFRVACLKGLYKTDDLINHFKEIGDNYHTIVLMDAAMTLADRRHLARKIKHEMNGQKAFLLIDRVDIAYLARNYNVTQINRILMLITMPFSFYQPYVWESSNVMPAEMFMGRKRELSDIENPAGANIVYGGRQLGKSALLKMAVKDYDHDEKNDRAILVDIKGKDYKSAAKRISQELSDQDFFFKELITEDWDELARAIKKRLREEGEHHIPYFLLLLDEADAFIASCEDVGYQPIDALKDIQGIGTGRFKFVIAGLRNIIRFNRDKALKNNSVLTHLSSMTVKPFNTSEARELLERPLYYLGFRFPEREDALIPTILANTNYFPGLIQLYCAKMIDALSKQDYAGYNQAETPSYLVERDHIKKVLADPTFMDQIREKFEITLRLGNDRYYYIIALLMAYLYYMRSSHNGYTPEDILAQINDFSIMDFQGFNAEQIEALMEELCELNVFRKKNQHRYLFSRYTFFQLMGTQAEVEDKLLEVTEGDSND